MRNIPAPMSFRAIGRVVIPLSPISIWQATGPFGSSMVVVVFSSIIILTSVRFAVTNISTTMRVIFLPSISSIPVPGGVILGNGMRKSRGWSWCVRGTRRMTKGNRIRVVGRYWESFITMTSSIMRRILWLAASPTLVVVAGRHVLVSNWSRCLLM